MKTLFCKNFPFKFLHLQFSLAKIQWPTNFNAKIISGLNPFFSLLCSNQHNSTFSSQCKMESSFVRGNIVYLFWYPPNSTHICPKISFRIEHEVEFVLCWNSTKLSECCTFYKAPDPIHFVNYFTAVSCQPGCCSFPAPHLKLYHLTLLISPANRCSRQTFLYGVSASEFLSHIFPTPLWTLLHTFCQSA